MADWKREEIVFDGTGKHVCKWEYHKDDAETIPRDCIWVDQVQWLPYGESEHDHTLTTEVPVPYLWLDSYGLGRETDFESAAKMKLGKVDGAGRAMPRRSGRRSQKATRGTAISSRLGWGCRRNKTSGRIGSSQVEWGWDGEAERIPLLRSFEMS